MTDKEENIPFDNESGKFGLPAGYFQKSADSILNKFEWLEEHKPYPVLNRLERNGHFDVPESYFDKQSQKLELLDTPVLLSLKKAWPFTVPKDYFKEQGDRQLLLNGQKPAKVISLFRPGAWLAVAATLVLALGLWLYGFYFTSVATGDCGTVACMDKKDLLKSKALESLETDELYDLVNSKKLEEKLEEKLENKSTSHSSAPGADNKHKKDTVTDELLDEI